MEKERWEAFKESHPDKARRIMLLAKTVAEEPDLLKALDLPEFAELMECLDGLPPKDLERIGLRGRNRASRAGFLAWVAITTTQWLKDELCEYLKQLAADAWEIKESAVEKRQEFPGNPPSFEDIIRTRRLLKRIRVDDREGSIRRIACLLKHEGGMAVWLDEHFAMPQRLKAIISGLS